jgi:hypothetical protein
MRALYTLSLFTAFQLAADASFDFYFDDEESILLAETAKKQQQTTPPQAPSSSSMPTSDSCCKPCCVPKPKKCIDCVCYTPPFYESNGCDAGLFFTADFLYWYSKETNLMYAVKQKTVAYGPPGDNIPQFAMVTPEKVKYLGSKWAPGFRVGLGANTECDGWDYYIHYTWYRSKKSENVAVDPNYGTTAQIMIPLIGQETLQAPWVNPGFQTETENTTLMFFSFDAISANWKLFLQNLTAELGRKLWLSRHLAVRPYAALRGARVQRNFQTIATRIPPFIELDSYLSRFKSRFNSQFWGAGIEVGIQPEWYCSSNFAFISQFDAALLWGQLRTRKKEDNVNRPSASILNNVPVDFHESCVNNFSKMQAIFDLMIGIRWDQSWACDRFRTALDIGWEQHFWLNFGNMVSSTGIFPVIIDEGLLFRTATQNYVTSQTDLVFGGLTVRFRLDF